jgi:SsrA-binding protein
MGHQIIATNRKARHEYHILEKYEAGIVLLGSEVKAIREGKANVKESYIRFIRNELWIIGMHIGEYSNAGYISHNPTREKKLLLNRKELDKLIRQTTEKGMTMIPLSIYLKDGRVKLEFSLAKGKKLWDKRHDIAKKDSLRQAERDMKGFKQ